MQPVPKDAQRWRAIPELHEPRAPPVPAARQIDRSHMAYLIMGSISCLHEDSEMKDKGNFTTVSNDPSKEKEWWTDIIDEDRKETAIDSQPKIQRNLQLRIEEQGRFLQMILEKQRKSQTPDYFYCGRTINHNL
ncbi:hypothetical protein OPV22_030352 [Ensete ventricosum]|uniref:MYB-CC type transcription factor LHEQLE-containing domain-containing protein n=1 Tax=Ensete ventricosum TaxID=4639 RepID=A0AAV8Q8R6_ENSVE|nr:hypothetical protein OPV22_030352 [Ensete ventricosum]